MAAPALLERLLGALRPLLARLPFLPKSPSTGPEEPFQELEDEGPLGEESFAPNALAPKTAAPRARIDVGALIGELIRRPAVLLSLSLLALLAAALLAVSLIANAAPPSKPSLAEERPPSPEGMKAASRLLLPPDPARALDPPMERPPHFPYTDEDLRRLAPGHGAEELAPLAERNDRAMEAIFEALP